MIIFRINNAYIFQKTTNFQDLVFQLYQIKLFVQKMKPQNQNIDNQIAKLNQYTRLILYRIQIRTKKGLWQMFQLKEVSFDELNFQMKKQIIQVSREKKIMINQLKGQNQRKKFQGLIYMHQ
ncbi:hypothetical protein pb186bvf_019081 [Paramecium bursaria]